MLRIAALACFLIACPSSSPPPQPPPGSGSSGGGTGSGPPPANGDNDPSKAPAENAAGCKADPGHCCQADGTIIQPTCSPVIKKPSDQYQRGKDGTCSDCPLRCLPPATQIRTPSGEVRIDQLHAGDLVMTVDLAGRAIAMPLLDVSSVPRTGPHVIAVVELADGRVARGSPEHPIAGRGTLGALSPGDLLDGALVLATHREPFVDAATWDILPAGPTATYWADGVLLGSTLRNREVR